MPGTAPPPLPAFTRESAAEKVRAAEDSCNNRARTWVAAAYSENSTWRNRAEFFSGRDAIEALLHRKWSLQLEYKLIKELWCWTEDRIAVRFAYEWRDHSGGCFRSHGNELWAFAPDRQMARREASINDVPIGGGDRLFRWLLRPRPSGHPGLTELGL